MTQKKVKLAAVKEKGESMEDMDGERKGCSADGAGEGSGAGRGAFSPQYGVELSQDRPLKARRRTEVKKHTTGTTTSPCPIRRTPLPFPVHVFHRFALLTAASFAFSPCHLARRVVAETEGHGVVLDEVRRCMKPDGEFGENVARLLQKMLSLIHI